MLKSSTWRARLIVLCLCCLIASLTGCSLLPNRPPTASFAVLYNVDADALVVDLDASTSSDPDGDAITSYLWTFGDDVEVVAPLDYSKTVDVPLIRVRYPEENGYQIQLLVIDERGAASAPVMQQIILPNIPVEPTP